MYEAQRLGLPEDRSGWVPARKLMRFLESAWQLPDDGIWEVRSGRRHFVHSKMMAWVAVDRSIRIIEEFSAPEEFRQALPRMRALRDRIHATSASTASTGSKTRSRRRTTARRSTRA